MNIIEGAGLFIYPLGLCSILSLFMIIERWMALRTHKVIPSIISNAIKTGQLPPPDAEDNSVAGNILHFYQTQNPDIEALKAYTKLEAAKLERGLFVLDIITAAAPLLGLLGTVVGLIQVFSHISPDTGMPEPTAFIKGIALALTTTVIGLTIAIPTLTGNSFLGRKVDVLYAKLEVLLERLIELAKEKKS